MTRVVEVEEEEEEEEQVIWTDIRSGPGTTAIRCKILTLAQSQTGLRGRRQRSRREDTILMTKATVLVWTITTRRTACAVHCTSLCLEAIPILATKMVYAAE